jgi:hypothetical protein
VREVVKCLYVAEDPVPLPSSPTSPRSATKSHRALFSSFNHSASPYWITGLIMLEAFEILTASGVVLWSKSYAPVGAHVINSLINDVFIEEKVVPQSATAGVSPAYKKEKYTLKWKRVKEFDLIFVVRLSHAPRCFPALTLSSYRPSTNRCYTLAGLTNFSRTFRRSSSTFTRTRFRETVRESRPIGLTNTLSNKFGSLRTTLVALWRNMCQRRARRKTRLFHRTMEARRRHQCLAW